MYGTFITHLDSLLHKKGSTLLAISGGVDSIVLLHLFAQSGRPFEVAHAHFGLRGKDSDEDETFVQSLAKQYRVPYHSRRFATGDYAATHRISIQMAARELRYAWFKELLKSQRLSQVATAHHENDNLETFLRNLVKGSGLKGLTGISGRQGAIIRPLLWATKKEIIGYATSKKLVWRADSSNEKREYDRNYIRHEIVPKLKKLNPSLERTFARTRLRLAQADDFFQVQARALQRELWKEKRKGIEIAIEKILGESYAAVLLHYWLKDFGFGFEPLYKWAMEQPQKGKILESRTHKLVVESGKWWLVPHEEENPLPSHQIGENTTELSLPNGIMSFSFVGKDKVFLFNKAEIDMLDAKQLLFPLTLRPWKVGDRFYPLGMGHTQKVSDFLTNAKVPHEERSKVYVLTSAEKIAWLVGYRIDERFKVLPTTRKVYSIRWQKDR